MTMRLTVLIATVGRAQSLRETLQSLFVPTNLAESGWETLVVVNSASDKASADVCADFQWRYPSLFRFLVQPLRGKARALNMGLVQACGELIAMTDDDVLCDPQYVAAAIDIFKQYPADAVQGRVLMNWIDGQPEWLATKQQIELSSWDFGDQVIPYESHLSGCNMVVRADVTRKVGGFADELGPGASGLNEDTEFSIRLRQAGYKLIYAPQVLVHHQMPSSRTTPAMLRRRSVIRGRSTAYYQDPPQPFLRLSQWYARKCLSLELSALRLRLQGEYSRALELQCESRETIGLFWQYWSFRLGQPRKLSYGLAAMPTDVDLASSAATYRPDTAACNHSAVPHNCQVESSETSLTNRS
jgi:glucosyl-dolichyl phosphate glucuronosyltransferase